METTLNFLDNKREEVCKIMLEKIKKILQKIPEPIILSSVKNNEPLLILFSKMYPILKTKLIRNVYTTREMEILVEILNRMIWTLTTSDVEEVDKRNDYNILFSQYKAILENNNLYGV